jgi:phosphatidyl-myo-inositol alpha-mannosyltransferase
VPDGLTIALLSPLALPSRDDVTDHITFEAAALARRGHRVTVLAPSADRATLDEGRQRVAAVRSGDASALLADAGDVLYVGLGRALPGRTGRPLSGPVDLARNIETAVSGGAFDVVHAHEPLAPSPALASLRHADAVRAASFHRAEAAGGAALVAPLAARALARLDLRIATRPSALRAARQILPGPYRLVPGGVPAELLAEAPARTRGDRSRVMLVARGRDRAGRAFGLALLRALDPEMLGAVRVLGPPGRRPRQLPRDLRAGVAQEPDPGPAGRLAMLRGTDVVIFPSAEEADGPVLLEAMAAGCAVVLPASSDAGVRDGLDAILLPDYAREAWVEAIAALIADPDRTARIGEAARRHGGEQTTDHAAATLEALYLAARSDRVARVPEDDGRVAADLRIRPGAGVDAEAVVVACVRRGLGVVGVASPEGLDPARRIAAAAPPELAVIAGQEIATDEGSIVGLFIEDEVPAGLDLATALERVRSQGGVVLIPHPESVDIPVPSALRTHAAAIHCYDAVAGERAGDHAAGELMRRLGILATAGSAAAGIEAIGGAGLRMRPFHDAGDFLRALGEAEALWRPARTRSRNAGAAAVRAR